MVTYNIKAWGFRDQILKEIDSCLTPGATLKLPEEIALYLATGWREIATSPADIYSITRHLDNMPRLMNPVSDSQLSGQFYVAVTDEDKPVIIYYDPFSVTYNAYVRLEED